MERILITGMNGATAPYVAWHALAMGANVIGTTRDGKTPKELSGKISCVPCDITDFKSVKNAIKKAKPDVIVQLAGVSTLAESWDNPIKTMDTNAGGTLNFLESLRQLKSQARIIIAGSREEYGQVPTSHMPIKETEPLKPVNPYGVAKAAADYLALHYFQKYDVQAIRARLFNQTAPMWPDRFVDSNWCKQIALIENGKAKPVISVGKLANIRDFTDCRDSANAYWLLGLKAKAGEAYNICSGRPIKMGTMLKQLLAMSETKITTKKDPSRIFKDQIYAAWGDNSKIRKHTGWKPQITLEQTHYELQAYWRENISGR